jgi:hypothetical protein
MITTTERTPEQYSEIVKCVRDPIYFLEQYMDIISPVTGVGKYSVKGYHKEILESVINGNDTIVLSPRQHGKTTIMEGLILWYLCFNQYKSIGIVTDSHAQSIRLIKEIQEKYQQLPEWIKPGLLTSNSKCIKADNDVHIYGISFGSFDGFRGFRFDLLWSDETQYVNHKNLQTHIQNGFLLKDMYWSQLVMTSSAGDFGSLFQWLWEDARSGKNFLNPIEVKIDTELYPPQKQKNFKNDIGINSFMIEFENRFLVPKIYVNPSPNALGGRRYEEPTLRDLWKWHFIKAEYRNGDFSKIFRP